MFLYLKRSQRHTWLGARLYKLAVHIETTPEERRIIEAHGFANMLAFIVPLHHVEQLEHRAETAYQSQKKYSLFKHEDMGKILWANAKVVALAIRTNYALHTAFRLTINDLIVGTIIECPNLAELVDTETAITKSFDALKRFVNHAATFEQDSETVLAPDDDEPDLLAPPSTWPRYSRH